ncbi:hypothetical protein PT974_12036 [Cladobotryum mycophilum]|uniref:Uncharacterized protein n=1 Tax=Cladobotryum mycophilum TaxID=491253 RepID=A0ABR0S7Z0_9HYPO
MKAIVEQMPAYRDVQRHAPQVLDALAKTMLIRRHSSYHIWQTLMSNRCVGCGDDAHGWSVFLLTFERVCHKCQDGNPAFELASTGRASRVFGLRESELRLRSRVLYSPSRRSSTWLVCIEEARQLAVKIYGSVEATQEDYILSNMLLGGEASMSPMERLLSYYEDDLGHPEAFTSMAWMTPVRGWGRGSSARAARRRGGFATATCVD